MKYAVIGHWQTIARPAIWDRGYHFALGQELLRSDNYIDTYKLVHANGGHIIVDNGAAENEVPPFMWLVEAAKRIGADEIILPDVLRDGEATYRMTCAKEVLEAVPPPKRFIVPQGTDYRSWWSCLTKIKQNLNGQFATIGLPKHMEAWDGGRARALQMLVDCGIAKNYHIHMLGIYANPWKEIEAVKKVWRGIRGLDTGLPVACAQQLETMQEGRRHSLEWRDVKDYGVLMHNIKLMDQLCLEEYPEW